MKRQARSMEISEVRALAAQVISEQTVPPDVVQVARDTIHAMCRDAAEYGLKPADMVVAVLHPVFESKRGCDRPTCKARRAKLEEEQR